VRGDAGWQPGAAEDGEEEGGEGGGEGGAGAGGGVGGGGGCNPALEVVLDGNPMLAYIKQAAVVPVGTASSETSGTPAALPGGGGGADVGAAVVELLRERKRARQA
jgi:hypothetical protein